MRRKNQEVSYWTTFYSLLVRSWVHSKNCEKRLLALSRLSGCLSAWNNSNPIGRIFMKFDIWIFFEKYAENIQAFMVIPRWILQGMRNISGKSSRENQNANFTPKKDFPETYALYEIIWKRFGTALQATDENKIRRMRLACWVLKVTHTHTRTHTHTIYIYIYMYI